ncbi:MAG: DUF1587 domain-containing protein, partial [Schlesneria sp.]
MKVPVTCSGCGMAFKVDGQYAGRRGKCPNPECRQTYVVPEPELDLPKSPVTSRKAEAGQSKSLGWGEAHVQKKSRPKTRSASWFSHIDPRSFLMGLGLSAIIALMAAVVWPVIGGKKSSVAAQNPVAGQIPGLVDQSAAIGFSSNVTPLTSKYCIGCHGAEKPEAGLSLTKYVDEKAMLKDRRIWERAFEMIKAGEMPPHDNPQPTADEKSKILDYLHEKLHKIDCSKVSDPGRVTIRRLNRAEYNNTIRDLMQVTFRPADDFPSDDVGYGFDNIGDVLSLPPLLMEKYLSAAEKITSEAILAIDVGNPPTREFDRDSVHRSSVAHSHGEDATILVSNGDLYVDHQFPQSGDYILRVTAAETPAGDESSQMEFRLDGKPVAKYQVNQTESSYGTFEFPIHLD